MKQEQGTAAPCSCKSLYLKFAYTFFLKIQGSAPTTSAATADTAALNPTMWVMHAMKYSLGSASNLSLIPGIKKQTIRYVPINTTKNNTADKIILFIRSHSFSKFSFDTDTKNTECSSTYIVQHFPVFCKGQPHLSCKQTVNNPLKLRPPHHQSTLP